MFVDYLTVMILNLVAGLVILAWFVFRYLDKDQQKVAPGLLVSGFISTVTGLHMIFTWPLPGSNNIPMGEMSLLFGVLLLALGIAVLRNWDLLTLTVYAVFAGFAAVIIGLRYINLGMSKSPLLSGMGYIVAGVGGMLTFPVYLLRRHKGVRVILALVLLLAAAIWALTAYGAYWSHLESFSKWAPGGPA
jgi:putative membrane protein